MITKQKEKKQRLNQERLDIWLLIIKKTFLLMPRWEKHSDELLQTRLCDT